MNNYCDEDLMETGSFGALIRNLCIPTIIIMPVMVVYNMADIYFIGKTGDPNKIAAVSLCGPMFSILSGLGTLFGRQQQVTMFIDNEEVILLGEQMLTASLLMGPLYGLYQLCSTFLQSTGKASYATVAALLDKGLVYLPLLFVLNGVFGLDGVIYTAPVTSMISLAVGGVLAVHRNKKMRMQEGSIAC